ncbi:MAG: amidohydrolase family protein [Planctomycetaceae bacterium]
MSATLGDDLREAIYQAQWLTPDCEHLLSPGCLHVRNGIIQQVWEGSDSSAINLGQVLIVPGLINAHTHLEFSDLAQPLAAGSPFPEWIRTVIQSRRQRSTNVEVAIQRGWEESQRAGVTAVGEIATEDATADILARAGAAGIVFREILGLQNEAVPRGLNTARQWLQSDGNESAANAHCRHSILQRGISPHAPYSLHPALFQGLIELSVETRAPVAMHLAETPEELELLASHSGGLVDLLRSLDLWRASCFDEFRRPLDYLRELARSPRALVIHGNYLTTEELDFVASQPQMSVVYCPRTHAAFGHTPHPWQAMQARGIRVILGTDSRASNPDLSLIRELQFLQQTFPQTPTATLLKMVTSDAAEALGQSQLLGTLSPGKRARLTVITPAKSVVGKSWPRL